MASALVKTQESSVRSRRGRLASAAARPFALGGDRSIAASLDACGVFTSTASASSK
jgi:hypothetical protein